MTRWAWWETAKGLLTVGVLAVGCGGKADDPARDGSGGVAGVGGETATAETPEEQAPGSGLSSNVVGGLGWSLRDDTPAAAWGVAAVVDAMADRLLVFGGYSNDLWSMPLSGPSENRWLRLIPDGEVPPPSEPVSVFDYQRNRVLVLLDGWVGESDHVDRVQLWELTLGGTPSWHHLAPPGPSPGRELSHGLLALDADGERLFALGGASEASGTWVLSLENEGEWTRLADPPPEQFGWRSFSRSGSALVFDAPRQRLVAFGGTSVWELPLATGEWSALPETWAQCPFSTPTVDATGERVLMVGGECGGVYAFSLADDRWSAPTNSPAIDSFEYGVAALDRERGRALFAFSGNLGNVATNATWQLDLDSLDFRQLTPDGRGPSVGEGATVVWDPVRAGVVAFGGETERTMSHALEASAGWRQFGHEAERIGWSPGAAYDPTSSAILRFGSAQINADDQSVWSLTSKDDGAWEPLEVAPGPAGRADNVNVYDSVRRRLVIYGGVHDPLYSDRSRVLDDTWALTLDGERAWTQLAPRGNGPGKRAAMVGVFDSAHDRMLAYGGYDGTVKHQDLYALSLDDDPAWTLLEPSGAAPTLDYATAVYDTEGQRMIFVGAMVVALELRDKPSWHTFCQSGVSLPDYPTPRIALVPDGLFASVGSATFRFDLATPYCD